MSYCFPIWIHAHRTLLSFSLSQFAVQWMRVRCELCVLCTQMWKRYHISYDNLLTQDKRWRECQYWFYTNRICVWRSLGISRCLSPVHSSAWNAKVLNFVSKSVFSIILEWKIIGTFSGCPKINKLNFSCKVFKSNLICCYFVDEYKTTKTNESDFPLSWIQ